MRYFIGHAPMQFSDPTDQVVSDLKVIFSRGYVWLTGTEASNPRMRNALRQAAEAHGYYYINFQSTWLAVHKSIVRPGSMRSRYTPVLEAEPGKYGPRGITSLTFKATTGDKITIGSGHYVIKGDPGAKRKSRRVNVWKNRKYARAIGSWARRFGRGRALVFYAGDQNIVDAASDTFFGEPMTSCWDEIKFWPNTGHGNIDVIATYDRDTRVKCISARVLDDKELPLHTDHFLVEAVYEISR